MLRTTIRAMARRQLTMWGATVAMAAPAMAAPQGTTTTTSRPAPGTLRVRCSGDACADTTLQRREDLFRKLQSLRMQFETRMSMEEREALGREITAVIMALDEFPAAGQSPQARASGFGRGQVTVTIVPEKRGYLGVTFDGVSTEDREHGIIRWFGYPRIVSVDPESPAERAGLLRGDTLVAFNGIDVVDREFVLAKLLVPNERLSVRVRRDGDAKEFRVMVGEAPAYAVRRVMPSQATIASAPRARLLEAPTGVGSAGGRGEAVAVAAPATPFAGSVYFFNNPVAGATIEPLNDGLASLTGATQGVFVVRVSPESPAFRSGIRSGDVILSAADGSAIRSTRDLSLLVARADREEGVTLIILRERKKQELVLKW